MSKTFWTIVVFTASVAFGAEAQPLGGGLKIGGDLTDAFHVQPFPTFAQFSADSHNWTVGPYLEVRLPAQMAVEIDALYRSYAFSNAGVGSSTSSWEFPILVKHKMLPGPVKPYFEGGVSFSHLSDIGSVAVNHTGNFGIVVGGGVELHVLSLKISPELRYNGWIVRNFDSIVQSNRNQVALLVGIGF